MPKWQIYDHVDRRGTNVIEQWLDGLDARARAKVHAKIVHLRQFGEGLPDAMLSDTDTRHIKKLRSRGRINWRVFICKGPVNEAIEFTVISAVQEKDNKMPAGSAAKAGTCRAEIIAEPSTRRKEHDFQKYATR